MGERRSLGGGFSDVARELARRGGVRGLLRQLLGGGPTTNVPPGRTLVPAAPAPVVDPARERARRALAEARREMGGLLPDDTPPPVLGEEDAPPAPDLERLRAHLEEAERERANLRAEVAALRAELVDVRSGLDNLSALLPGAAIPAALSAPTKAASAPPGEPTAIDPALVSPPPEPDAAAQSAQTRVLSVQAAPDASLLSAGAAPAPSAEEGSAEEDTAAASPVPTIMLPAVNAQARTAVPPPSNSERAGPSPEKAGEANRADPARAALLARLFPGGTIGTRLELTPAPAPDEFRAVLQRLSGEPLLERVDAAAEEGTAAALRLSLRTPARWPDLAPLLERALPGIFQEEEAVWTNGVIRVTLAGRTIPGRAEPTATDVDGEDWLSGASWDAVE